MGAIGTVDELIIKLNQKTSEESYLDIMSQIDIPLREFEKYYSWNKDRYARNCLAKTDDFELLLICFEKGQKSPIHDFDSRQAWIQIIQGKLRKERFILSESGDELKQVSATTLGSNDYSFMSKVGIHRYKNINNSRTVSLNLYCKPIEHWTQYNDNANSTEVKVNHDSVYV